MRILALEDPTDTTMDILREKMFDKIFEVMRDGNTNIKQPDRTTFT